MSAYPRRHSSQGDYPPPAGGRGMDAHTSTIPRSISAANLDKLQHCREVIMKDFVTNPPPGGTSFFATAPTFTLVLPPLHSDPPEFKKFVYDNLTDRGMQKHLEEGHVLNWCNSVSEVVPLNTLRDGNCLLHAASLAMWGFQDRKVLLRKALSTALTYLNNTLYQRWEYTRKVENQRMGIELDPDQWKTEWQTMVRQASHEVQIGKNFDSLDDFHVFVLANVIRRPIILYAASKIHSLQSGGTLQEINFQGVYLPLLWEPTTCKKNPLPLAYDGGHFCALVMTQSSKMYQGGGQFLLPLVDYSGKQLNIKFTLPVEQDTSLAMDYLNLIRIGHGGSPHITTSSQILCAALEVATPPADLKPLVPTFVDACWHAFTKRTESGRGGGQAVEVSAETGGNGKCINDCGRYGDAEHSFLCVECFRKAKERELESKAERSPPMASQDRLNSRESSRGNWQGESGQSHSPPKGGSASLGTVKCPQCGEPGFPQLLCMCERCYGNNTSNKGSPIYEKLPSEGSTPADQKEPPSLPLPRNAKEKSFCRKPGCKFYGSIEKRFYCSKCFESDMVNILKEADKGPPIRPETPDDVVSPIRSKSMQQPPREHLPPPSPSGKDPPKCYQCQDFYADEAYAGLCNDCFLKSTLTGGPPSHRPHSLEHRPRQDMDPQSSRYPEDADRYYNPTTPNPAYESSRGTERSSESSRVPSNPTAPVTRVESKMAEMNMSSGCFMCNNGQMGDFDQFTVCRDHAFRLMQSKDTVGRGRKPSYGSDHRAPAHDYEVPQSYGNEVRGKPHEASLPYGNEPRRKSFGRNNLDDPHYQRSGGDSKQGRGADPTHPSDYDMYESRGREAEWSYHAQQSPGRGDGGQQHTYGNELRWPPPSGAYEQPRDAGGRNRNELGDPPQHRRDDQGRRPVNNLDREYSHREAPRPQAVGRDAEAGASGTSAAETMPKIKSLCAKTGCSFKGYERLKGLCPDCYVEEYKGYPDYYSPDEFPLV